MGGRAGPWPQEAGEFWYRWFPRGGNVYVGPGKTSAGDLEELSRELISLAALFEAPLLHKNTYNSMRIAPLVEAFPVLLSGGVREPDANARSILKARYRLLKDPEKWWSVPPKELSQIQREHYCEQVVDQVYFIHRQILEDSRKFGSGKFLFVQYEELCGDVPAALDSVAEFLESHRIPLEVRGSVPGSFECSMGPRLSEDEEARIAAWVRRRWPGESLGPS